MPSFVEWLMGFPEGWVNGVSRTQALKMLGNAVVPAQAALAMRLLTEQTLVSAKPKNRSSVSDA